MENVGKVGEGEEKLWMLVEYDEWRPTKGKIGAKVMTIVLGGDLILYRRVVWWRRARLNGPFS